MSKRRPYPSDLSDARWELVEPVLAAWRFERRGRALDFGRPPEHDLRDIMDAILYVDRTGVQWRYLPHDFPHWNTVYGYFARWQQEGVFAQLNGLLRQLLRQKEGREAQPSACVIDAQSVKTSTSVPASGQGIDAGKKTSDAKNVSSGEGKTGFSRGRKGYGLVEWDPVSQAVVEASDHPVEEVPLSGRVPVSGLTSAVVVSPRSV
jgi:transposase